MKYDLIICGAGPAGTAAAITAARKGLNVCLIERYGFAGGMATSALINPWMGHWFWNKEEKKMYSLIGGFFKELVTALRQQQAIGSQLTPAAFDEERLKYIYDQLLIQAGVKVLYHSTLIDASLSSSKLTKIKVYSKQGIEDIEGKFFIDATGDGDLAKLAGCDYSFGRPSDGLTQAMTVSFRMGNVDKDSLTKAGNLKEARALIDPYFQKARSNGTLNYPYRDFIHFYDYPHPGILHFNMTRINKVSGLSNEDLTTAEMAGRSQAVTISDWLIKTVPFFKNAFLSKLATQVGVRETRHIHGLYTMTHDDIAAGRKFDDAIVRSNYFIDIHSPTSSGFDHEKKGSKGAVKQSYAPPSGDYYEVPYRSIVPKGIDNMLIACRALSATHESSAAIRVMATMTGIGQAAGLAIAEASQAGSNLANVDGAKIKQQLGYLNQEPTQF